MLDDPDAHHQNYQWSKHMGEVLGKRGFHGLLSQLLLIILETAEPIDFVGYYELELFAMSHSKILD